MAVRYMIIRRGIGATPVGLRYLITHGLETNAAATSAGTFILNTSMLSGAQFTTSAMDMEGDFRDIQFRVMQDAANEDMELHYLEFHCDVIGVSGEDEGV